jgi:outer membrane protein OmpA-like peptidoglycan-associated protein
MSPLRRRPLAIALLALAALFASSTPSLPIALFIVFFEENSSTLSNEARAVLAEAVYVIREQRCRSIDLWGHTDGAESRAQELSLRRARVVRGELYRLGMKRSVTVRLHGRGAQDKMVQTEDSEPQNRRVVVEWCVGEMLERWQRENLPPTW